MNIKDGDYFSYTWKTGRGPSSDPYWCRDRRCVARVDEHGRTAIIDTYNYWPYKGNEEVEEIFTYEGLAREYSKYIDLEAFDLNFICNLNDYEFVKEYDKDDYDDVVFVGYQCTKKWAIPKGVQKSKTAMIKKFKYQLAQAEAEQSSAYYKIRWCREEIAKLEEQE